VPLLRSIPILGRLFGYSSKKTNRTNLLVFLTPKIIYDAETLQKISDEMKEQQKGLLVPRGKK
jgi:general secretion pathway protein D